MWLQIETKHRHFIDGIFETMASNAKVEGEQLDDSLRDLEALMNKAKDMV